MRFTGVGLRRARTLTVLGFILAVALIFTVLWVNMGGEIPKITGGYRVTASMTAAQNLVYDSDVRSAGVKVGKVRGLTNDGDRVMATIEIRGAAHPLHEGASVKLRPKTLIAETYLEVLDGKGPTIPNGGRLPDSAYVPSVSVDDLLNSLDPPTREAIGSLVRRLGPLTDGQAQNLSEAMSALGHLGREGHDALDVLAAQSEDLQGLVTQTAALLATLDEGEGQIARLASAADKVTAASAARDDKLEAAMRLLPGFLTSARQASAPLSQLSGALTPLAEPLQRAAPDLNAALGQLPAATSALRQLVPSLDVALARAPDTLTRTPTFAADVDSLIPPLRMALGDINPMLAYLAPYGKDLASFAANVGQVFSAVGPAGPEARILVILNEKSFTGDSPIGSQAGPLQKSNPYPAPGTVDRPTQGTERPPGSERNPDSAGDALIAGPPTWPRAGTPRGLPTSFVGNPLGPGGGPPPMTRAPAARVVAGILAAGLAVGAVAVGLRRLEVDTSAGSLVPASDRAVRAWQETEASFGGDPVVVLFSGAGGGDLLAAEPVRKLVTLEAELAALPGVAVVYGPGTTANQVAIGLNELLVSITARRDGLRAEAEAAARAGGASGAAAKAAGDRAVADYETRYGSLVAAGLPLGLPTLNNPTFAKGVFLDDAGRARPTLRWIVPDDAHAAVYVRPREGLDQTGTERLVASVRRLARDAGVGQSVTVTGAPVVAVSLGAEVHRELPRLGLVALAAVALAFLLSHRLPTPPSPQLSAQPSVEPERKTHRNGMQSARAWLRGDRRVRVWRRLLPLGLGLAAAVLTLAGFGLVGAPLSLGTLAFLPVMLGVGTDLPIQAAHPASNRTLLVAAVAGAAGFAALALSPLPFVRHLGLALAAGVLLSALLALPFRRSSVPETATEERRVGGGGFRRAFRRSSVPPPGTPERRFGGAAGRRAVLAVAGVLAVVGWALLPGLPIEARPDRLAAGLPALGQAREAEAELGASGEVAVRVRAGEVLTPELLRWFRQAEEQLVLRFGDRLRPVVSPGRLLGWLGDTPTPDQIDAGLRLLPRYLTGAAVRSDRKEAVASFGLRLGDLGDQAALLRDVRAALPPPPIGARVDVTGLPVVASRAYDLLSDGRLAASLAGPLLAGAVLLIGLRRRRDGLAALSAALLAIGWGVLALRVSGIGLSPLTVGLGSLTAAVGAEFVVFTRERIDAGLARPWPGGVAAALTSAAGFAALGLSRLEVLREFGLVLAGSVLLALLAASIVIGRHASGQAAPPAASSSPGALASVGVTG